MNYHLMNSDGAPTRAELVALVDGRLDAIRTRQIELWLAVHPDDAAVVEEHRQVLCQVRDLAPPQPSESDWDQVWGRIDEALPASPETPARPRRRVLAVVAGIAALLLLTIPSHVSRPRPQGSVESTAAAPILLASADEVEIVSIDGADLGALLVGEPPLRRPLELAAVGDVELNFAEAGEQGWIPAMGGGELGTSMYVVPMPSEREEKR